MQALLRFGDEGEPDVVAVPPQVVVGDPGVAVDHGHKLVQLLRRHPDGAEGAGVAQLAGGEVGPEAPDDPGFGHGHDPGQDSASEAPTLLPTSAYGRDTMGKWDWISFKMARSRSSKVPVFGFRFSVFSIVIRVFLRLGVRY